MKFSQYYIFLLVFSILFVSCQDDLMQEIEFIGVDDVQVKTASKNEVVLETNAIFYNSNDIKLTAKKADVNVNINGLKTINIQQNESINVPKLDSFEMPMIIRFDPQELWGDEGSGLLNILETIISDKKMEIVFDGKINVGRGSLTTPIRFSDTTGFSLNINRSYSE